MSYTDWKKKGYSKGTLHQLKQKAKADQPFTLNRHVMDRLREWNQMVAEIES